MSMKNKTAGVALAIAAAGMFAFAPMSVSADEGKVKCYGVNKCKGHNDCKSATNSCKGQSSCKGKGFVKISAEACDKVGGKAGS